MPRDHNTVTTDGLPIGLAASYPHSPPPNYQAYVDNSEEQLSCSRLTSGRFPFLGSPLSGADRFSGPDSASKEHRRAQIPTGGPHASEDWHLYC